MMVKTLKAKKRMFLGIINLAIFVVIVIAGLWPFSFWPENRVRWLTDENGLQFYSPGIIFTPLPLHPEVELPTPYPLAPFSLEIWLQAGQVSYDHTARILSFYDGEKTENIVLSQWKSTLLLQKRIQDHPEESYPKVGVKDALLKGVKRLLTITSGPEGTRIYMDGKVAGDFPKFNLPSEKAEGLGRLILGNSPKGNQSWTGHLFGLAIYNRSLRDDEVLQHFRHWEETGSFVSGEGPVAFYPFDERSGKIVHDSAGRHHLFIPSGFEVLQKTILVPPWKDFRLNRSYLLDILTNILGFIPFGFFFSACLWKSQSHSHYRLFMIPVLIAGGLSLLIELLQVYLPTRSSQLMDVICNTVGAGTGSTAFLWIVRRQRLKVKGKRLKKRESSGVSRKEIQG
jgi:VanZ family protein